MEPQTKVQQKWRTTKNPRSEHFGANAVAQTSPAGLSSQIAKISCSKSHVADAFIFNARLNQLS